MSNPLSPDPSVLFATAQKAASENTDAFAKSKADSFWEVASSAALAPNWNKLFPYQLVIMKRNNSGTWVRMETQPDIPQPFTLPIAPQSLTIDMTFAMQVEATQGGIIEQSNGSPFRDIVLQGTTGVLPLRGTTEKPTQFNVAQGIFAGTVQAATTLGTQVAKTLNVGQLANVIPEESFEVGGDKAAGTGFSQFLLLKRFLEWYANAKKRDRNLALGFAVWKEEEIYLVTPSKFTVTRSVQNALAYNYSLAMRAWKRVTVKSGEGGVVAPHVFPGRDADAYAQVLNKLDESRRILENARGVLQAVRGDVNNAVFGNIRRVGLFVKDAIGTALAASDLPAELYNDFKDGILESKTLVESIAQQANTESKTLRLIRELQNLQQASGKASGGAGTSQKGSSLSNYNGQASSPAMALFTNPEKHYDFWSRVRVESLNLRPETTRRIEREKAGVRNLRREDFEVIRTEMAAVLADLEASVGVSDETYTATFGSTNRSGGRTEPSDADWNAIFALGEVLRQIEAMAASSSINRVQNNTPSDFVAGLARRSGIAFTVPTSKFLVPFPYDYSLEQLSAKYLGTPDRWMEIATLNGLKSPYVDEIGFVQRLLTNATGNKISVADSSQYHVGQPVWLSAIGVIREKRRIIKIEKLQTGISLVTVDGDANLETLTTALEAEVHAYLPETVNSLQFIYIPSSDETETDWLTKSIPGVDTFDPLYRVGGVDLLIDSKGDLVISKDGTTHLAVGLTNLIQRLRIGIATPQGSLARHPEFGFGVNAGTSTADVSAKSVLAAAKSFVANESGFSGVSYAAVRKSGSGMTISLAVEIAGVSKTVPITVDLK